MPPIQIPPIDIGVTLQILIVFGAAMLLLLIDLFMAQGSKRLIGYLPVKKVRQPTSAMYQQARDAKALGVDALGFDVDYASVTYLDFIRGLGMGLHLYDLGSTAKIRFAVAGGQQYVAVTTRWPPARCWPS